jgi:hypothetical protein
MTGSLRQEFEGLTFTQKGQSFGQVSVRGRRIVVDIQVVEHGWSLFFIQSMLTGIYMLKVAVS